MSISGLIDKTFRPYKGAVYRLGLAMPEPEYETATGRRLFTVSQMEKIACIAAEAEREACAVEAEQYLLKKYGRHYGVANVLRSNAEVRGAGGGLIAGGSLSTDGLCTGGQMNVPNRREGESELEHLRRKEVAFGIWQGDALERMRDLEADLAQAVADRDKYRLALNQLHEALFIAQRYAMLQGHEMSADSFARDFAPFRNVMAHHGVEPYAKPKRARKVGADRTAHNA